MKQGKSELSDDTRGPSTDGSSLNTSFTAKEAGNNPENFLTLAEISAESGDVGAVFSNIELYRDNSPSKENDNAKITRIFNEAYKNGVERYLGYAEKAISSGHLFRAGQWLENVKACIEKGNLKVTPEQQERIDVLEEMTSKIM